MLEDFSFGIVPVIKKPNNKYEVFLIQHLGGHWSFPKGHPNEGELPIDTAIRELLEETNLSIDEKLLSSQVLTEQYSFRSGKDVILKIVKYYIGNVINPELCQIDRKEVLDGKWIDINEAPMHLTFEEARRICREAAQILQV